MTTTTSLQGRFGATVYLATGPKVAVFASFINVGLADASGCAPDLTEDPRTGQFRATNSKHTHQLR